MYTALYTKLKEVIKSHEGHFSKTNPEAEQKVDKTVRALLSTNSSFPVSDS